MVKTKLKIVSTVLALTLVMAVFCAVSGNVSITAKAAQGDQVFLNNTAGWANCYCYAWGGTSGKTNAAWPGVKMTLVEGNIYSYTIPGDQTKCIFSNNGSPQTSDLTLPASGGMYDNKAGSWGTYDTSPVHFTSFGATPDSPQYKGMPIAISAAATSENGAVQYRFSVIPASTGTEQVLQDYSASGTYTWTPTVADTYTVRIIGQDPANNTSKREFSYTIMDDTIAVPPVFKAMTPSNNSPLQTNAQTTINVNASGGHTGTNLLFYKFVVTDPSGKTANVPYYTLSPNYTFTPTSSGTYTVAASVQGSDNQTITTTYTYSVSSDPLVPIVQSFTQNPSTATANTKVTLTAVAANGTAPYTYQFQANGTTISDFSTSNTCSWTPTAAGNYTLTVNVKDAAGKTATSSCTYNVSAVVVPVPGDANCDGVVNLKDATLIQKYLVGLSTLTTQGKTNADYNGDSIVNLKDATAIQKKLAGMS
ncbi:MAG: starch-binding protein [Bacillota bacterium]|nr:starch-binding protein [Bacillota bacterium]